MLIHVSFIPQSLSFIAGKSSHFCENHSGHEVGPENLYEAITLLVFEECQGRDEYQQIYGATKIHMRKATKEECKKERAT